MKIILCNRPICQNITICDTVLFGCYLWPWGCPAVGGQRGPQWPPGWSPPAADHDRPAGCSLTLSGSLWTRERKKITNASWWHSCKVFICILKNQRTVIWLQCGGGREVYLLSGRRHFCKESMLKNVCFQGNVKRSQDKSGSFQASVHSKMHHFESN